MQRALGVLVVALMLTPLTAAQGTTDVPCATNNARSNVDESSFRYFCEAMDSSFFIQFDQFQDGLIYLEENYPDFIEVKVIGETLGGLPVYFVEVTNEQSATPREDKLQIGYSASIHANEAAGREGMARVIEDLAAGIGPHGAALQPLLDEIIVNVWFPNADSWAGGDYFSSTAVNENHAGGFQRANAAGVDLNREFPNPGLIHKDHTPMSEPESQAVVKELRFSGDHSNLVAGTDLHGMINSDNMMRMIIPNQDYDFRRMVLSVDQLLTIEDAVNNDPAFEEWKRAGSLENLISDTTGQPSPSTPTGGAAPSDPLAWGARYDMIGYTDTGFTSDYLMLSPRSPTGGMGAVGTITEFAYSHMVPDNNYVAKLTDMHVAGVRQIVKAQMEMAGRLDTPVLTGTGPVGYAHSDALTVSSLDDPGRYDVGRQFDPEDPDTWFDFDQVEYEVSSLNFWRDLGRFSSDPITPVPVDGDAALDLTGFDHFVITDIVYQQMNDGQIQDVMDWVDAGGHLFVTDAGAHALKRAGIVDEVTKRDEYLGLVDVQDWDHPLMKDVTWDARVTGEGPAIGFNVGNNYPNHVLGGLPAGAEVVGTTGGQPSLVRMPHGEGSIDFLGAALPQPRQVFGDNADHRYGLADYSVSAFTYWLVMNSLGGSIEWVPIDAPFVPCYSFDPLYGGAACDDDVEESGAEPQNNDAPALPVLGLLAALFVALLARRR